MSKLSKNLGKYKDDYEDIYLKEETGLCKVFWGENKNLN